MNSLVASDWFAIHICTSRFYNRKVFEYKSQLQVNLGKVNKSVHNFVLDFGLDLSYCRRNY